MKKGPSRANPLKMSYSVADDSSKDPKQVAPGEIDPMDVKRVRDLR